MTTSNLASLRASLDALGAEHADLVARLNEVSAAKAQVRADLTQALLDDGSDEALVDALLVEGDDDGAAAAELRRRGTALHPAVWSFRRWSSTKDRDEYGPLLAPRLGLYSGDWSENPASVPDPTALATALTGWIARFCPDIPTPKGAIYGGRVPVAVSEGRDPYDRSLTLWVSADGSRTCFLSDRPEGQPNATTVAKGDLVAVVTALVDHVPTEPPRRGFSWDDEED